MTLVNLFREPNETGREVVNQSTHDTGVAYFARLKSFGAQYMQTSGFKFLPRQTDMRANIQGLLDHAVNHHGQSSALDKAAAFLAST